VNFEEGQSAHPELVEGPELVKNYTVIASEAWRSHHPSNHRDCHGLLRKASQ
jgi:hypothetical protein